MNQAKLRKANAQSALIQEELGDLQFMQMSEQLEGDASGVGFGGIEDSPIPVKRKSIGQYSTAALSYNDE